MPLYLWKMAVCVSADRTSSCPVVMQTDRIRRRGYTGLVVIVANIPMALWSFTIAASLSLKKIKKFRR